MDFANKCAAKLTAPPVRNAGKQFLIISGPHSLARERYHSINSLLCSFVCMYNLFGWAVRGCFCCFYAAPDFLQTRFVGVPSSNHPPTTPFSPHHILSSLSLRSGACTKKVRAGGIKENCGGERVLLKIPCYCDCGARTRTTTTSSRHSIP